MYVTLNCRQVLLSPILVAELLNGTFIGRKLVGMMNKYFERGIGSVLSDK
jgi:hypothetical protein